MSTDDANDFKSNSKKDLANVNELKYLVINVANEQLGFELSTIREIIRLPDVTIIPDSPDYLRGMIKLRDLVIPLIDIRKKMGFQSIEEENNKFISMLKERENDHIQWVNELINSVTNRTEFKLTTDPHACKFGKWYDNYTTQNFAIKNHLEKFDKPHKAIHKLGQQIQDLMKRGEFDEAKFICSTAKDKDLKNLMKLFEDLYLLIQKSSREFAVVFENKGKRKAITCDKINRILTVLPEQIQKANTLKYDDFVKGICQTDDLLFVILDESILA